MHPAAIATSAGVRPVPSINQPKEKEKKKNVNEKKMKREMTWKDERITRRLVSKSNGNIFF